MHPDQVQQESSAFRTARRVAPAETIGASANQRQIFGVLAAKLGVHRPRAACTRDVRIRTLTCSKSAAYPTGGTAPDLAGVLTRPSSATRPRDGRGQRQQFPSGTGWGRHYWHPTYGSRQLDAAHARTRQPVPPCLDLQHERCRKVDQDPRRTGFASGRDCVVGVYPGTPQFRSVRLASIHR